MVLRALLAFAGLSAVACHADDAKASDSRRVEVTPASPQISWPDYQIIMWQPKTALQYARLHELGVTGAATVADRERPDGVPAQVLQPLMASGLSWYVENIATDFYSAYHRWFPDRPVNWQFERIKELYRHDPNDPDANRRIPSLSDAAWLGRIERRLTGVVVAQRHYRPLFYDLADETGIADLNAPWDFDFSEPSLQGFRRWLRRQYHELSALNREWRTDFPRWSTVMPMTTGAAMARDGDNFAPWCDFKAWMDLAYAWAVREGTDAVHRADPTALAGIEGVQSPGWGGYNYERLADAADLVEGTANWFPVLRSLNPKLFLLTTSFRSGPAEERKVWHAFLSGARGLILWDPHDQFVAGDGTLGIRARNAASYFRLLRGGIGALVINSRPEFDPVGMLYSQAGMRIQWMLDWRGRGDEWSRQDTDVQNRPNPWRGAMWGYMEALRHLGLTPRFMTAKDIDGGGLRRGLRVLILPDTLALSGRTAEAIRTFVRHGGTVIADREPGWYDAHGRRRDTPVLHDLFVKPADHNVQSGRTVLLAPPPDRDTRGLQELRKLLDERGVTSPYSLTRATNEPADDIAVHRWRNGSTTIIGLERIDADERATQQSEGALAATKETVTLRLPHPAFIYDLLADRAAGVRDRFDIVLDPVRPTFLVLSPKAPPTPRIIGPTRLIAGRAANFGIDSGGKPDIGFDVFKIALTDASGHQVSGGMAKAFAPGGRAMIRIRPAREAAAERWTLTVTAISSGTTAKKTIALAAPERRR